MCLRDDIKKLFIKLFVSSDDISREKELFNLESFLSSIESYDFNFEIIPSSNRKNCVYAVVDVVLLEFCQTRGICLDLLKKTISFLVLFDCYNSFFFLFLEENKNEISLDKLLNGRLYYTKILAGIIIYESKKDLKSLLSIKDEDVLLKYITDLILIRYGFKSKLICFRFEKKWKLSLNKNILEKLKEIKYRNIDVRYKKSYVKLKTEPLVGNIINNSSFDKEIWINKFNLIKINKNELGLIDKERADFMSSINKGISNALRVINFLNNSEFIINKNVLKSILMNDAIIKDLKDKKRIMTLLSLKESEYISKFNKFYFDYVMDNRTRIYIKNIPLNTQLEKILRPLVITELDDDDVILNKYIRILNDFSELIKVEDLLNIFKLEEEKINDLIFLINNKLNNKKINTKKLLNDFKYKKISIEIIFIQQLWDILNRFDINNIENEFSGDMDLDKIGIWYGIKEWLNNKKKWLNIMWYNDASSNVLQILILKLFIWDEYTLKICNIFDNDTKYKDVYDYILNKITNEKNKELMSRKLIKSIIMPGLYGQTFVSMRQNFDDILEKENKWKNMSKGDKNKMIKEIENKVWNELKLINLNLSDYLKILKRLPYETREIYWNNMYDMPIILDKEKNMDRKKILDKIKINILKDRSNENIKLKEKLNKDDINYLRKNLKIDKNKYIKIRYKIKSNKLDLRSLSNAITPSSNHADDASILFKTLDNFIKYEIKIQPIHDSIGTMVYYSSISKILFKLSNLEFIEYLIKKDSFPFDKLNKTKFNSIKTEEIKINLLKKRKEGANYYIKNKKRIFEKIINSKNFFN